MNHKFQNISTLKMRWEKPIFNEVIMVTSIKCCVCFLILEKNKILMVKWDSIDKHVGKRKVFDGMWFMDPKCGHVKHEIVYI